jgi:cobalt/nickel transport system permease protein
VAEAVMSAGLFSYLRRSEPGLVGIAAAPTVGARYGVRKMWGALAVVLLLTPLGILAGGAAWGEWAPKEFAEAAARARIAATSGNTAPPAAVPSGMARLATVWTAPLPDYAPHFVKSAGFGYLLSAMFGVGLIVAATWLVQRLTEVARRGER